MLFFKKKYKVIYVTHGNITLVKVPPQESTCPYYSLEGK